VAVFDLEGADMPIYPSTRVIASPTLTGDPTAPTATSGDDDTSVATTEFVTDAIATQAAADADTYATPAETAQAVAALPYTSDYRYTLSTSAQPRMVRPTERNRRILIVTNLTGNHNLLVGEAVADTYNAAGSYTTVPVGSEYVTSSINPVWAYYATSGGDARVYAEVNG
jgi:hypothetical protein